MKIWLITDTHLGHGRMVELCGRPVDFSEQILSNLKKLIQGECLLIHLGDICIGQDQKWNDALNDALPNTPKILIRGNHDTKSDNWYMHNGWKFVAETISNSYFGKKVLLSHFPIMDNGYDLNIHGHFHNSDHRRHEEQFVKIKNPRHKLFAIEYTKYCPIVMDYNFVNTPQTIEEPYCEEGLTNPKSFDPHNNP